MKPTREYPTPLSAAVKHPHFEGHAWGTWPLCKTLPERPGLRQREDKPLRTKLARTLEPARLFSGVSFLLSFS